MTKMLPATWRSSVDELKDRVMHTFDRWLPGDWRRESRVDMRNWPPAFLDTAGPVIDLEESDDDIVVTAELPGLFQQGDRSIQILCCEKAARLKPDHLHGHGVQFFLSFFSAAQNFHTDL